MQTRKTMTISLPPEILKKVDLARKLEHQTRSEMVREALRIHLRKIIPVDTAHADEITAMELARGEHARGEYVTLDTLLHELGNTHRRTSKKTIR
jgi:metal-responsive CopG/Arc/MetJ family transcriptional regulator